MALVCPIGLNVDRLKDEIRRTYASVAREPEGDFHFHRGPEYAARALGYDLSELISLPRVSTAPFAGVEPCTPSGSRHQRQDHRGIRQARRPRCVFLGVASGQHLQS